MLNQPPKSSSSSCSSSISVLFFEHCALPYKGESVSPPKIEDEDDDEHEDEKSTHQNSIPLRAGTPSCRDAAKGNGQMAKGLVNEQNMMSAQEPITEAGEELDTVDIGKQLERVKWFLWQGNVGRALDTIEDIEDELDLLPQDGESRKKLLKAVREFHGYIEANQNFIPNYGDRYRFGGIVLSQCAAACV
jgi:hypothetical protein